MKFQDEIELRQILIVIFRNWKFIGACALLVSFITALFNLFLITPYYESRAVIMPHQGSVGAAGLGAFLSVSSSTNISQLFKTGIVGDELFRYQEILKSRSIVSTAIDDAKLLSYFDAGHFEESDPQYLAKRKEALIRQLQKDITIELVQPVLILSFRHTKPRIAQIVVQAYLDQLKNFMTNNYISQAKNTELFIEKSLADALEKLERVETEFVKVQKAKGVVQLPSQLEFSLSTAARLRSQIIEKDIEIARYRDILKDSGEIKRLEEEKAQIQKQIDKLIEGTTIASAKNVPVNTNKLEVFTPLQKYTDLEMQISAGQREYLSQVRLVEVLRQQLEISKIESKKDESIYQIVDQPVEGVLPVGPKKTLNTILGFLIGGVLSCLVVILLNFFPEIRIPRFASGWLKI